MARERIVKYPPKPGKLKRSEVKRVVASVVKTKTVDFTMIQNVFDESRATFVTDKTEQVFEDDLWKPIRDRIKKAFNQPVSMSITGITIGHRVYYPNPSLCYWLENYVLLVYRNTGAIPEPIVMEFIEETDTVKIQDE